MNTKPEYTEQIGSAVYMKFCQYTATIELGNHNKLKQSARSFGCYDDKLIDKTANSAIGDRVYYIAMFDNKESCLKYIAANR